MLLSHLLIISLVGVTINGQVGRTFTCSRNPDAGATTSKAEAPTTNVGATITKAGTTTTKAGTTTTKADAPTTNAEAPTTNVGATTAKAGTTTTKAGVTTTKAGETTTKAGEPTTKSTVPTTNVGATTTKARTTTTKAGEPTSKAGEPTTKAEAPTTNFGATTTKIEATTTKARATTTKAGVTTIKVEAPTFNVGATTIEAGATTNKAGATTTKAGATTTKAGNPTNKAGATTNKASINDNGACSNMSIVNGRLPNCTAIYIAGCRKSGIYKITPNGRTEGPFKAYCDMETVTVPNWNSCLQRGWTVFQRRVNGSVDFNRNWKSYKEGFGQLDHEFWLGNEKLHYLTQPGTYRLRIDLVSNSGITYHACYQKFHIKEEGEEGEQYELHASGFASTSNLRDGLSAQIGKAFSTSDRDNTERDNNCADIKQGGWWREACNGDYTNLNGVYGSNQDSTSIYWNGLPNGESIKSSEMKIRHCKKCDYYD